jgi:hypothetical protein
LKKHFRIPDKREEIIIKKHAIQPYTFIIKNNLSFFQGNVIKYVVADIEIKMVLKILKKIIHYCQLEIEEMREGK